MYKLIIYCGCLLIIIMFNNCKKENQTGNQKVYFKGITQTGQMGELISDPDNTDWRFDDIWNEQEDNLFSPESGNTIQRTTVSVHLFPNPTYGNFIFYPQNITNKQRFAVRLVDKNFKILYKNDSIYNEIIFEGSWFYTGDTIRLYYELIDSLSHKNKGHGDILILKN